MKVNYKLEVGGIESELCNINNVELSGNIEFDIKELQEMHRFSTEVVGMIRNELPQIIVNLSAAVKEAQRIHGIS